MYDHIAASYNELHGAEQRRKLSSLLAVATLPDGTVLDVGCGTAHLSTYFLDYVGVDPSQPLLDQAPSNTKVVCARGEDLPFDDNSFPVVVSLTALHNYDDWHLGIDELFRVCSHTALVGVLKKSAEHDAIVSYVRERFSVIHELSDQHDLLLVLHKL